ncbi:hypothetical protein L1765_13485 [Microaerobacter geothermalis]|uniref:hypothetical protein n=1 Tax=Microaerobacter geothermalis TaxID=674972 RepID=UPI001F2C3D59|nr:hypothetical protein [Microaerobacter geothermalis]MCF6094973.1 hypothetical protein [Microaerobacter geothermalis]
MTWTIILGILAIGIYMFTPMLDLRVVRKAVGIIFFLELFYIIGYYLMGWPFPTPLVIMQIFIVVGLGVALGVVFSRAWPLSPRPGFERVMRTLLLVIPSLGLGIGLQLLLQGNEATQAIYLMFALSAWLGSGHFVRKEETGPKKPKAKPKASSSTA